MATFKCDCGKVLANSICPNDIQLILFTDREWENIREKVSNGFDIYDAEPQYDAWRCTECERIYFFKDNKLVFQYAIEKDYRKS
ncbi:hypothetical protein [Paenibacillus periandrae]|uniref:hypothetical protein n=1 Tax=Paenibacillus periandrae TaxID=1761741 RepID=UPI001F09DF33|nr:hypothetical protein [Paenibacillus periandrae]